MPVVHVLLPVVTAALGFAAAAEAATVRTLGRCYQERADVVAAGAGFAPSAIVTVWRDGTNLGSATTDSTGTFARKFTTPRLPSGKREVLYDLVASDGANSAITHYRATKLLADFSPGMGDLATLRVRFRVRGFNLLEEKSSVYLHYIRPSGQRHRTIRLGTARGSCGHIRRTRRRYLFPFEARRGLWKLQFDTRKIYEPGTDDSNFVWVRRRVRVYATTG